MSQRQRRILVSGLLVGLVAGLAAYHLVVLLSGHAVVSRQEFEARQSLIDELRQENSDLTEELFRPRDPVFIGLSGDLPYDDSADAASEVEAARARAREKDRYLMVTFGANWCLDCRTLHHHLGTDPVASYTRDLFEFVNVDVGKFNQNSEVATELGVSLSRGIPVAIFFGPDGEVIGTTNEGQLEPSRHYSSKQILKFVRDIVERSRILSPDSVE